MPMLIYHNPRCSKSRKTLQLIEASGVSPRIIRYLDEPPGGDRIVQLAGLMGVPVRALMRGNEAVVKDAQDLPALDDDAALADWIARNPQALERPIVVSDDGQRAIIGRPPENVEALLT
ncbi:MAG: ArsC/Spx/MgsR family protein [Pseudomonadota bacterium]